MKKLLFTALLISSAAQSGWAGRGSSPSTDTEQSASLEKTTAKRLVDQPIPYFRQIAKTTTTKIAPWHMPNKYSLQGKNRLGYVSDDVQKLRKLTRIGQTLKDLETPAAFKAFLEAFPLRLSETTANFLQFKISFDDLPADVHTEKTEATSSTTNDSGVDNSSGDEETVSIAPATSTNAPKKKS